MSVRRVAVGISDRAEWIFGVEGMQWRERLFFFFLLLYVNLGHADRTGSDGDGMNVKKAGTVPKHEGCA